MGSKAPQQSSGSSLQASTSTYTPSAPAMQEYQSLLGQANSVSQTPFQSYNGQLVAPFNSTQNQAVNTIGATQGQYQPALNAAQGMTLGAAGAFNPQNIQNFYSPFQNDVVNSTMANMNNMNAQQQQQVTRNAIAQGAMGGDRVGVAHANLAGQQALANGQTIAGLQNSGYQNALNELNTQQQAGFQGAGQLANLAGQSQGLALQGAGAQLAAGTQQQQTSQAQNQAAYQQFLRQAAYPFQNLSWLSSIASPVAGAMGGTTNSFGMGSQQQQTPGPNIGSSILGGGLALGSMFPTGSASSALSGLGSFFGFKDGGAVTDRQGLAFGGIPYSEDEVGDGSTYVPGPAQIQGASGAHIPQAFKVDMPQLHPAQQQGLQLPKMSDAQKGNLSSNIGAAWSGLTGGGVGNPFGASSANGGMDFGGVYANGGAVRRGYDGGGLVVNPDDVAPIPDYAVDTSGQAGGNDADPVWGRMIHQESGGHQFDASGNTLTSPKGAAGVAQVMPATAPEAAQLAGLPFDNDRYLHDADYNKALGHAYYQKQLSTFGSPDKAAAAYNAGPGAVMSALGKAEKLGGNYLDYLPDETKQYVANVASGGLGGAPAVHADAGGVSGPSAAPMSFDDVPRLTAPQLPKSQALDAINGLVARQSAPSTDGDKILGLIPATPEMRQSLLAAGLGMMASRSPWLGQAVGEGGLAGIGAYQKAIDQSRAGVLAQGSLANTQSEIETRRADTGIKQQQLQKELFMLQRQIDAARMASVVGGGNVAAGSPVAGGSSPVNGQQPTTQGNGGQPQPAQSEDDQFLSNVDPRNNPRNLLQQADVFRQQAEQYRQQAQVYRSQAMPEQASGLDSKADAMIGRANDMATRADTVAKGPMLMRDGTMKYMPSFVKSQSDYESQKLAAQEEAKNAAKPAVTPSGVQYIPPDSDAASPGPSPVKSQANPTVNAGKGPQQATIDPQTAQVHSVIPQAPEGGGYPIPNVPKAAKVTGVGDDAKELAKTDSEFSKDMLARAPMTDNAIDRYKAIAQAFKTFESGSPADKQHAGAAFAAAAGFPGVANMIMRGDPAGAEWVRKEGVNIVLDTLKAATPRFAQSEFNKLSDQGTPNITNRPEANHQLVSEGLGLMLRNKAFMNDWEQARQNGWSSVSSFYTNWTKQNPLSQFTRAAQRQIGNFKGMDVPPRSDWVNGGIYTAWTKMTPAQSQAFGKRGVTPGQMFKYDGQTITPVKQSEAFTSYLGGQ